MQRGWNGELAKLSADTNTLISGTLWTGASARLLAAVFTGRAELFMSEDLFQEFEEVLARTKFERRLSLRGETAGSLVARVRYVSHIVRPAPFAPPRELRDLDDAIVLACARTGEVEFIVSGDQDLLVLKSFEGMPILTATEALRSLGLE